MLTRQLNESKDSLHFANQSCEQLEVRVEELERSYRELERTCEYRQESLQQKNWALEEIQGRLSSQQEEHEKLGQRYHDLEQALAKENEEVEEQSPKNRSRSVSLSRGSLSARSSHSPEAIELQDLVDTLTVRLQNSNYQKQKLEQELHEVAEESQVLGKSLEKAEQEISDMQVKIKAYEESAERQSYEASLSSPRPSALLQTSTPVHGGEACFQYTAGGSRSVAPLEDSPSHYQSQRGLSYESVIGTSLFGELDAQYSSIKQQYDDLLQRCTCSASVHHHRVKLAVQQERTDSETTAVACNAHAAADVISPRPFRELFEEVFATLKQTAQVADRLIERGNV